MRKAIEKQEEPKEVQKKKLTEAFALWRNESKSGVKYLKGADLHKNKLVGFFNTNKKNPKEPDVRIYSVDSEGKQDKEVASLWAGISKNEKPYLTGSTDEKEKLVAFYDTDEKHPYIKAYFKEEE